MNNEVGLGIFGTFGEPHGFQQVFYYGAQFRGSLDLNDSAIEFYPGADLYAVRREIVDGVHSICICIYSYAQQLDTTRMGTFLGSCMVLQDGFTEAEYIYKVLHSMHDDLMTNPDNVEDQVIKAEQGSDIVIREPAEFVAAQANLIPLNRTPFFSAYVDDEKTYLVVPSPHAFGNTGKEVVDFIDEALKHYSDTGTVYFSFDKNVYEFVRSSGIIPILEWNDFIERKLQMQQSTAVRTKKGIQKAPPSEAIAEISADRVSPEDTLGTSEQHTYYNDDVEVANDPFKPFLLWDQPEEVWSENEIRYRVNEYNRLFRYTNTLVEHINEPVEEESKGGKKRVLVAGALLLLIGGSVAVYYLGVYRPSQGASLLAVRETPRIVQQSNIVTDSAAAISVVDSSVSAEMAASLESKPKNKAADIDYNQILADLNALEAKFEDQPEAPSVIKEVIAVNTNKPAEALPVNAAPKDVATNGATIAPPTAVSAPAQVQSPVAPAGTGLASAAPSDKSAIPDIHVPPMPRANLPASALYSGKPRTEPAYVDFKNVGTTTTTATPPAKPASPVVKQQNNVAPAITTTVVAAAAKPTSQSPSALPIAPATVAQPQASKPATAIAATQSATVAKPATQSVDGTVQAVAVKTTPVITQSVTAAAQPVTTKTTTTTVAQPFGNKPAPATAQPVTSTTISPTTFNKATPAVVNTVVATTNSVVAAAKPVATANVSPAAQNASTNSVPSSAKPVATQTASVQPTAAKRDSNKTPAQGTTAGNTANTFSLAKAPISSGVSAGEMTRANAVALPQLKTSPDPEQVKLKTLYPRPNGNITQRDIPVLSQAGIKNKTLTQLTQLIMDNAPESVGKYYKGQELQYAAALLNSNRQAFQRIGNDYVCTGDYLMLHIPAIIKPSRPAVFPK